MARTRRLLGESIAVVDVVIELRDARIPMSSENPELRKLTLKGGGKPVLVLLNKASLADADETAKWIRYIEKDDGRKVGCLACDCITGEGFGRIVPMIRSLIGEKISRDDDKGMKRTYRAMAVGIPNVGKSSFSNRLAGKKITKVENRPGVTMKRQWVTTKLGLDLLDTPGVLWPNIEDPSAGLKLAVTGAVKDDVFDYILAARELALILARDYPARLEDRFKVSPNEADGLNGEKLLLLCGRKRGMLILGGEVDEERAAKTLLTEFRTGKLGRITLDRCPDGKNDENQETSADGEENETAD